MPLSVLITVSVWKIDVLRSDIADLSSVEANLNAGNKVMLHLLIADKLRLNKLKNANAALNNALLKDALINNEQVMMVSNTLVGNNPYKIREDILLSFTSSFHNMNEAFIDVKDFSDDDIDEWSAWIIDGIVFELFISLEKLNVHTNFDEINQNIKVVNQLRWIMLYALQENWFIQMMLERRSFKELEELRMASMKENIFIERFLSLNASEQQIETLLSTFQEEDFLKSLSYKENMLSSNLAFFSLEPKDQVEQVLNNRLSLMMGMSQNIISTTNNEIKDSIHSIKHDIYWLMILIVVLTILIVILGANVINRIFVYLKSTISRLEKIETENDYSIQISESGKDELSNFSSKLNLLIAERKINIDKMVQSKEDAEKANKAKSYFLANMSHEIRTPLNGILGMYHILSNTELSHSQKNNLETINLSSKTLLILINDILDISKIESGKLTLSESPTHFREALYETVSMLSPKAVEKKLKLSVYIDASLPTYLLLDEHRLRQIVMNLLSNALKFTEKGTVELLVSGKKSGSRCILNVQVKDTGIGIAQESQSTIFQPFVQEDGSVTREFGGTGLGLAISTQLVQLMGGQLNCTSEKGKGSTFSFDIDLAIAETEEEGFVAPAKYNIIIIDSEGHKAKLLTSELTYFGITEIETIPSLYDLAGELSPTTAVLYCQTDLLTAQQAIKTLTLHYPNNPLVVIQETDDEAFDFRCHFGGQIMIPLSGKCCLNVIKNAFDSRHQSHIVDLPRVETTQTMKLPVLLVEDNLVNQKVALFFLTTFGYDFEVAENGLIAVEYIKEGRLYSAILMDCMMPIMDGFTATEKIRAFEEQENLNETPIIALTASVFDEDIRHCYEVGMNDYLAKPIDKAMFESKMKKYILPVNRGTD